MATIHNIQDLRAIQLLETELLEVRNELRQASGYDPAMSLAENAKFMIDCARCLGDMYRRLRTRFVELKKEQENDKMAARSYPIAGVSRIFANAVPKEGEFHPENLLGSTDGYGR